MNLIDVKFRFYTHALVLDIVDINEVNEWLFEVIEQNDLDGIPDDFFELVHYDQKQMLNYISEQRLTQMKSLQQGRDLLKYYLNKNQLLSSQCLLDDRHLEKLFNIVNYLICIKFMSTYLFYMMMVILIMSIQIKIQLIL